MAKTKAKAESKYIKEDILKSEKYREFKDVLTLVLKDDYLYTDKEIEKSITDFINVKVVKKVNK